MTWSDHHWRATEDGSVSHRLIYIRGEPLFWRHHAAKISPGNNVDIILITKKWRKVSWEFYAHHQKSIRQTIKKREWDNPEYSLSVAYCICTHKSERVSDGSKLSNILMIEEEYKKFFWIIFTFIFFLLFFITMMRSDDGGQYGSAVQIDQFTIGVYNGNRSTAMSPITGVLCKGRIWL